MKENTEHVKPIKEIEGSVKKQEIEVWREVEIHKRLFRALCFVNSRLYQTSALWKLKNQRDTKKDPTGQSEFGAYLLLKTGNLHTESVWLILECKLWSKPKATWSDVGIMLMLDRFGL